MKNRITKSEAPLYGYSTYILNTIAIVLLSLVFVTQGNAQAILYNDGGTLYTDKSSILHIEGDLQNKTTATIQNDGVIELMGDLTNDSTAQLINGTDATSTERAYKFIGTGTQALKGNFSNSSTRYIYNMIIDKATSGSALELQTAAYVSGSLVFGSTTSGANSYTPTVYSSLTNNAGKGIIKTYSGSTDYELFVTNSAANAVMGYAPLIINGNPTDGFIQNRGAQGVGLGGFSRNASSTGAAYVFPVASATNGYNAAALTFTSLGATPDKITNMFVDATGGVGFIRSSCAGCGSLSADNTGFNYHFNSNPCNGSAPQWVILDALPTDHGYWSFVGNSADQYVIETYPNSFPGFAGSSTDDWRIIKRDGAVSAIPSGDWNTEILSAVSTPADLLTYNKNSPCYSGTGVPGGVFTGLAHFQMARTQSHNALPVEILYITAQAIENKFIRVNWATSIEVNNSGFKVMRSTNGIDFEEIGWVQNQTGGNSTTETDYYFDDVNAQPNVIYYYKLNQVDFDGNSKDTRMVQASIKQDNSTTITEFFPNPASESTSIIVNTSDAIKFNVELYNMTGQLLLQNEINATSGSSRFNFSTGQLPQGNYRAVLKSDHQVFTRNLNIIK